MIGRIEIVNVRGMEVNCRGVAYCGRSSGGWADSVLGNPFKVGPDGDRDDVIMKYRIWLRWMYYWGRGGCERVWGVDPRPIYQELVRLAEAYRGGAKIVLGCWCVPLDCHCRIVKGAIEGIAARLSE